MPVPLEVSDICLPPAMQQAGSADRLVAERAFPLALRFMARGFLAAHEAAPRTAALFATQQRWLLCHAGLAQYFLAARCGGAGSRGVASASWRASTALPAATPPTPFSTGR